MCKTAHDVLKWKYSKINKNSSFHLLKVGLQQVISLLMPTTPETLNLDFTCQKMIQVLRTLQLIGNVLMVLRKAQGVISKVMGSTFLNMTVYSLLTHVPSGKIKRGFESGSSMCFLSLKQTQSNKNLNVNLIMLSSWKLNSILGDQWGYDCSKNLSINNLGHTQWSIDKALFNHHWSNMLANAWKTAEYCHKLATPASLISLISKT